MASSSTLGGDARRTSISGQSNSDRRRTKMVTKHQLEQGSEEWLKPVTVSLQRSNAIKLLKYGRKAQAMAKLQEFKGNYWTKRGHNLEPW